MNRRISGASPLAFGEGGIKERVKNVLNFKKSSRRIMAIAVALAAVLTVGFSVNGESRLFSITPDNAAHEPHSAETSSPQTMFELNADNGNKMTLYTDAIALMRVLHITGGQWSIPWRATRS
jgi:hypothetical protein